MSNDFNEKVIMLLPVSSLLFLTLFLFGPAQLYYTNILEFNSSYSSMSLYLVVPALLCILLTTTLLALLKPPVLQRAVSLLFALAALLWFQGNILVWDYGPLDGRDIDWSVNAVRGFIDAGIWIAFIIISLAAARVSRMAPRLSVIIIAIQLIATVVVATIAPDASYLHKRPIEEVDSVFEFSPERNVVILVLDSFQGDVFHGIINEDPYYGDIFDGFTYYRNSLSGFSHTPGNVVLILTGQYYENLAPLRSFLKTAFSPNSAPKVLKENGYQVDLVCTSGFGIEKILHADGTIASSRFGIRDLLGQNVELKEATLLVDLTLFRYLPHFLKKYVYNNHAWVFSNIASGDFFGEFPSGPYRDDIEFIKAIGERAQSNSDKPTFKYIHLWLPHAPIRVDERLEYTPLEPTRENYVKQSKGTLELANMFFEKLKELGIYENTTIFVLSDHGSGIEVEEGEYGENDVAGSAIENTAKGRALSLFLVKPFMSTGKLRISDAPVSLSDVAKTIVSELGLEADIPGVSVFDVETSDTRDRRYLFHTWETGGWSWIYLPPMREYVISGRGWLDTSWHSTNKLYEEGEVKDIAPDNDR